VGSVIGFTTMPLFKVTETKTITLTHLIEARDAKQAEQFMAAPGHHGLKNILEDDCEIEYDVHVWTEAAQAREQEIEVILASHSPQMCETDECITCSRYYQLLTEVQEEEP
jgi:hypothetical protein